MYFVEWKQSPEYGLYKKLTALAEQRYRAVKDGTKNTIENKLQGKSRADLQHLVQEARKNQNLESDRLDDGMTASVDKYLAAIKKQHEVAKAKEKKIFEDATAEARKAYEAAKANIDKEFERLVAECTMDRTDFLIPDSSPKNKLSKAYFKAIKLLEDQLKKAR